VYVRTQLAVRFTEPSVPEFVNMNVIVGPSTSAPVSVNIDVSPVSVAVLPETK
jgi:hypothetical protein